MEKEDIILQPKTRTVTKAIIQKMNTTDLFIDQVLAKYPKLTEISEKQNLTTAPYEHVIDTGDSLPIVTRDFRRSAAENETIAKEVNKMLAKNGVIL